MTCASIGEFLPKPSLATTYGKPMFARRLQSTQSRYIVDQIYRTLDPLMNDHSPTSVQTFAGSPRRVWPMTVVDAFYVTPRKRRVRLVSEFDGFAYRPGQSLVLLLPQADGAAALRHYAVRDFDAVEQRLDVDFLLRGDGPATQWVRDAALGHQ